MAHSDEEFYHFVRRSLDAERRVQELEGQLKQGSEPASPEPTAPTVTRSQLGNLEYLRSQFPGKDVTKMLLTGELKVRG